MSEDPREDDALTSEIIAGIICVHQTLGLGFLESIYHRALHIELNKRRLSIDCESTFFIYYDGRKIGVHRPDLIVEQRIVVELKTVSCLTRAHYAQIRSYLRATNLRLGILVNFADSTADFRRVENIPYKPR